MKRRYWKAARGGCKEVLRAMQGAAERGGARFALFNKLRSPAGRAEPVQMSGAVVVALVGTRFTGNVGLASGAGIA